MESLPKSPTPSSPPGAVSLFRSRKKSARLHPLEIALLILTAAHLCFLPWALGSMHLWSQIVSAGLAACGFILSLLPRTHAEEFSKDGSAYRYIPYRRLIAFPGFWLGLAVIAYVTVQALNPAWIYNRADGQWWMEPIQHITWLPAGATTPFADSNPWRSLMIWGSAWLLGCSLWIGLTRRASLRLLLVILTVNATVLALVGILQHVAGNGKILWFIQPSTTYSVSTFLYKNHAGAYFNLMLAATVAVATWYYRRAERRFERASPAPVFTACAVVLSLVVALSFSRAATILMLGFIGAVLFLGAFFMMRSARRPNLLLVGFITLSLTVLAFVSARQLRLEQAADKFQKLFTSERLYSVDTRELAAQATWEMASDRLATGWGAGGFRFLFPLYQQRHPIIYQPEWDTSRTYFFEHAHNEYLEFLAELGVIGCLPLLALFVLWMVRLIRRRVWQNPAMLILALGLLVLLAHCWVDFDLRCPAILMTACALAVIAIRGTTLDSKRRSR